MLRVATLLLGLLVPTVALAGGTEGAGRGEGIVNARKVRHFTVEFSENEPAVVEVRGDGHSNLDCHVFDDRHNLVASDRDPADRCSLRWEPNWTGYYTILIVNRGAKSNHYTLTTN